MRCEICYHLYNLKNVKTTHEGVLILLKHHANCAKHRISYPGWIAEAAARVVLKNFAKFTGKHTCQSLFFNKITGLRVATLLKEKFMHKCFPVNFVTLLRTRFSTEHIQTTVCTWIFNYSSDFKMHLDVVSFEQIWKLIFMVFFENFVPNSQQIFYRWNSIGRTHSNI